MRIFCSICKELFSFHSVVCITNCGHLYHEDCLKLWQARSGSCPECRTKIKNKPDRVYFNTEDGQADSESIDSLRDRIAALLDTSDDIKRKNAELEAELTELRGKQVKYEEHALINKETIRALQEKVNALSKEKEDLLPLRRINESLRSELRSKANLETLLQATESEVHDMLSKTPVTSLAVHQLCVYVEALKHQLKKEEEKYKKDTKLLIEKYEKMLQVARVAKSEKNIIKRMHQATNTMEKMITDSDEENEVHVANSTKRARICFSQPTSGTSSAVGTSSKIFKVSKEIIVKKVVNNLNQDAKKCKQNDSSDIELQIYPGCRQVKFFRSSAARESCSIFSKARIVQDQNSNSENVSDLAYDIWGGQKKNPLARPSSLEDIKHIKFKPKKFCSKKGKVTVTQKSNFKN